MTTEEMNVAIAAHVGWRVECGSDGEHLLLNPSGTHVGSDFDPSTTLRSFAYKVPRFSDDLNAIHSAIMRLPAETRKAMRVILWELTDQMTAEFADAPTMARAYLMANGLL